MEGFDWMLIAFAVITFVPILVRVAQGARESFAPGRIVVTPEEVRYRRMRIPIEAMKKSMGLRSERDVFSPTRASARSAATSAKRRIARFSIMSCAAIVVEMGRRAGMMR